MCKPDEVAVQALKDVLLRRSRRSIVNSSKSYWLSGNRIFSRRNKIVQVSWNYLTAIVVSLHP